MDKKIAGLLGAVAGLAAVGSAHAAVPAASGALEASSYGDLLAPIPNAAALLEVDNAARAENAAAEMKMAQAYYYGTYPYPSYYYYHHHHHHHHHQYRRYYSHHHHHHHNSAYIGVPGVGGVVIR